jgi:hypothetical protein
VRPRLDLVIGQLPQRWAPGVEEYNRRLMELAAAMDDPESRVVAAPAPEDFSAAVDTYDGAHPTPVGELKIAEQYAAALAELGLPTDPA